MTLDKIVTYIEGHSILKLVRREQRRLLKKETQATSKLERAQEFRDLVRSVRKTNQNNLSTIVEGYVYAVINPSFPEFIKIGSTVDLVERLSSYQTSDPNRGFKYLCYQFVSDRLKAERELLAQYPLKQNEWIYGVTANQVRTDVLSK